MENREIKYKRVDFDPFAEASSFQFNTTEAQKEIWTNVMLGGHDASCSYNESVSVHLSGKVDAEKMQHALDLLVLRHDSLRSTFSDDGLSMIVSSDVTIPFKLLDLSGLDEPDLTIRIDALLVEEAEEAFDLERGPLGRVKLIRIRENKYQLILTFHHIVCDGWSLGIILQELSSIYSALVEGKDYELPGPISYAHYSEEEESFKQSEEYLKTAQFWLDKFKDNPIEMQLPLNLPRPAVRTYKANRIDLCVDPGIISSLRKVGINSGNSFITSITAAFEIYLHRITLSSDVVLGLAAAGQSATGMERLVGHCVNLLLLRSKIDGQQSFTEYLKMRKSQILDAYDNQRYTYGSLVQKLNLPRVAGHIPLVPVSFNVDLGLTDGVEFTGCTFEFTTNPRHYENFEFFINAAGKGDNLTLECTFNTNLFTKEMMQLRLEEFIELLKSIIAAPDKPVSRLNILTESEKQNIFKNWIGPEHLYNKGKCIHELIDEIAEKQANDVALIYNDSKLTYSELRNRSNAFALYLIESGISKGDRVGLYMPRNAELIVSIIGIMKAGAAYVPIDLTFPQDRIEYVLDDAGCKMVVTSHEVVDALGFFKEKIIHVEDLPINSGVKTANNGQFNQDQFAPAYLIYTSGSTGKPKGVVIEHFSLVNYISWSNDYYFGDRNIGNFGLYSSMSFDLTVTSIFCALTRGKSLTIFKQDDDIVNILYESFRGDSEIDSIKMTPAHVLLLENSGITSDKVRKAIVGGEELTELHVKILQKINPAIEIVNEYGPTEATVGCVIKDVIQVSDSKTIGRPIANSFVYILDQNEMPLPPGILGYINIGGFGLARGYHEQVELTDEKFRILTINNEPVRLYNSGDLGRFRINGELDFLGRIDDQVKVRGYRIELGEVEAALLSTTLIKNLAVVVREDVPGDKRIAAYLVVEEEKDRNQEYFLNYLKASLPEYMVPSSITFMDELPLTSNGKINKKALPSPERGSDLLDKQYEEPTAPTEQVLANIWCAVLGLEKVGRNDNFFELGGHSLLAVKLFNEIEKQTGIKLNLSIIFTAPTIKELAGYLNNQKPTKPISCLVPLQTKGTKTPLFCVHMHNGNVNRWRVMIKHLGPDQPVYAIQPVGLDIYAEPHTSIEQMATHYIKVMKGVQPTGPYNLIGLCFSGMVVYEMAIQLQKNNESVSFLGMINNYAPPENRTLYRIKKGLNKFMKLEMGEKFQYAINRNKEFGMKILSKAGVKSENKAGDFIEEVMIDEGSSGEIGHDLRTIHSLALLNYHPNQVYNGNLAIIRTDDPIDDYYNEYLGWDRLVKGEIMTTIIPGSDTDTIITDEPYNIALSKAVGEYLSGRNGS